MTDAHEAKRPPASLCPDCAQGLHFPELHTSIGCLTPIDSPPYDYICSCPIPRPLAIVALGSQNSP